MLGLIIGAASATKLTGWFIPLPMLAWVILNRDRRGLIALLAAAPVALLTIYALIPPWWHDPVGGFLRLPRLEHRPRRVDRHPSDVPGQGLSNTGRILPPENTIVWTAMVTPIGVLRLSIVGLLRTAYLFRADRFGSARRRELVVSPRAAGHAERAGTRRRPAVLASLRDAGNRLWSGGGLPGRAPGALGKGDCGGVGDRGPGKCSVMMPVPLSYYSPAVGGLPGRVEVGDGTDLLLGLDDRPRCFPGWTSRRPPDRRGSCPRPFRPRSSSWKSRDGLPRRSRRDRSSLPWFVVQNRTGELNPIALGLIRDHRAGVCPESLASRLLWVFPFEDVDGGPPIKIPQHAEQCAGPAR